MESWLESFARANFLRSADTAHDLKTPLNVAVLNLELLRMRTRKLAGGGDEDEKIAGYTRAIEVELRRMGRIFDTFFILSTPPKGDGAPANLDLAALSAEAASRHNIALIVESSAPVLAHEARIRHGLQMFFEGASNLIASEERDAVVTRNDSHVLVTVTGRPDATDFELTKVFKFYYTDPQGNPDLSLAAARLIAETYGGELIAVQESDKVSLRLSFPLGEQ